MTDFFLGFALALPSALLITYWVNYIIVRKENSIADDINIIKEDVANLTVKLSGFLNHV